MIKKRTVFVKIAIGMIILLLGGRAIIYTVYAQGQAADSNEPLDQQIQLKKGEKIKIPWEGQIEISDADLLKVTDDGYLESLDVGEVEICVRYRVKIDDMATEHVSSKMPAAEEGEQKPGPDEKDETKIQEGGQETKEDGKLPKNEAGDIIEEPSQPVHEEKKIEAPYIEVNEKTPILSFDPAYSKVELDDSFVPRIRLQNPETFTIVSCAVNGMEAEYTIENEELIISRASLSAGKNRIIITVQDQEGNLTVMTPWEFVIKDEGEVIRNQCPIEEQQKLLGLIPFDGMRGVSVGLVFILVGGSFVFYEQKKYGKKIVSED